MARYIPIIHVVAAVLTAVELALGVYLVFPLTSRGDGELIPGSISFLIVNAVWSILVLAYIGLSPRIASGIFHELAAIALEWLTVLSWFGGSIALANLFRVFGAEDLCDFERAFCHALRAAIVFGFIDWLLFLALAILDTLGFRRGRSTTTAAA